jgi:hypothetical protein
MHQPVPALLLVASSLTLGCQQRPTQPSRTEAGESASPALTPSAQAAELRYAPRFDPDNFVRKVDNRFFPLVPGTRYVSGGEDDGEPATNVFLVTHDRKNILGISATVVLDRAFVRGELVEKTFDWFAQDKQGNVWYLGEDSREIEDGKVVSTEGSWEAGVKGARAGIIMPAHPRPEQHYRQEIFPGEAEDEARVTNLGLELTVPYGRFRGCIRTVEWSRLERGVTEAKYYCPNVGFVKARGVEGTDTRMVLKNVFH